MSSTDTYAYSSDNNDTEEYVDLIGYDNYEILTTEPFTIRRKDNKLVVSEHIENNGYLRLTLRTTNGQVTKLKHRLIAEQFLPNPNNLPEVDHIDRDKLNNSLNNLRWVSRSDNNRNRTVSSFGKLIMLLTILQKYYYSTMFSIIIIRTTFVMKMIAYIKSLMITNGKSLNKHHIVVT